MDVYPKKYVHFDDIGSQINSIKSFHIQKIGMLPFTPSEPTQSPRCTQGLLHMLVWALTDSTFVWVRHLYQLLRLTAHD